MRALGGWCFRRRRVVLALWLVALVGIFAVDRGVGNAFSTRFQLHNTQSSEALSLVQADFSSAATASDQIVLHATEGTLRSPAFVARIRSMLDEVARLPHVRSVSSPYEVPGQMSRNGTVAFATVTFDKRSVDLPIASVAKVMKVAQEAGGRGLQVALGGQDIENAEGQSESGSTVLGIVLALAVLGIAFGALFAAFLPLITALTAIAIGYFITGLISHGFAVASFAPILGVLLGLGVGVDYALFIVTRHRTGLKGGRSVADASVNAVDTSGRAVFFAGITVCIALLGQFLLGISFLYGIALSAAITVALTMLASLTLLPALLGFMGTKVLSRRQRAALEKTGPVAEAVTGGWRRWAEGIQRRPVLPAALATGLIVLLVLPLFGIHLGLDDAGTDQAGSTTRQAYDLLAQGFGPGFNGPFELVAAVHSPAEERAFDEVVHRLSRLDGVAGGSEPAISPDNKVAVAELYPTTSPQSTATAALLARLRDTTIPKDEAGTGLTVLVGGATAVQTDFTHVLAAKLPLFVGVVIVLAFLLLMALFRSLLIPLVASVMNLLSVAAALGILTAIFTWGWGRSLFGISVSTPVAVFVPVLMFSILFGLSMDYEVFLISRMHEDWLLKGDNHVAVTLGQAETGRVITAAAAIMILVFSSFVFGGNVIIKQFGIGLATAIVIDAFIIRTVLVPALMHLFGKANWWLPGWLSGIIPRLHVESGEVGSPELPHPLPQDAGTH